jgi:hypothetical protein
MIIENELTAASVKVSLLEKMENSPSRVIAPIECDDMSFQPPAGLFIAGFSWTARRSEGSDLGWEIDENLVDTVVAWSALGNSAKSAQEKVECVLEVGYQEDVPAEDLIHLASSGEFSLALVGLPDGSSDQEAADYCKRLGQVAAKMLRASNFSKSFYPFSNEFEALFLERMGKVEDAERLRTQWSRGLVDVKHPSGARVEYALKRTPLGRLDVRAACLAALLEHFGSQEMLDVAIGALARPIAKRVERFADEIKAQPKAKQERFGLTPTE